MNAILKKSCLVFIVMMFSGLIYGQRDWINSVIIETSEAANWTHTQGKEGLIITVLSKKQLSKKEVRLLSRSITFEAESCGAFLFNRRQCNIEGFTTKYFKIDKRKRDNYKEGAKIRFFIPYESISQNYEGEYLGKLTFNYSDYTNCFKRSFKYRMPKKYTSPLPDPLSLRIDKIETQGKYDGVEKRLTIYFHLSGETYCKKMEF